MMSLYKPCDICTVPDSPPNMHRHNPYISRQHTLSSNESLKHTLTHTLTHTHTLDEAALLVS